VRAPVIMHGKTSAVRHDGSGVFAELPDGLTCTRYHSLVVVDPPPELRVNAWVDEVEQRTIMGLRHAEHPTWGVQFHPESVLTEHGHAMLAHFLALVRAPDPAPPAPPGRARAAQRHSEDRR